ncbi:MAG: penicillin-binding transpeptidase domain-containing protein [Gemmatimonadota bacterium]
MTPSPTRYRWRRRLLLAGWLVGGLVIVARSASVQILQGSYWTERALAQHQQALEVPGRRGAILDRNENPLATSNETFQVSVAPRELRPETRDANVAVLASELGLSRKTIRSISDPEKSWVEIQEGFPPRIREALEPIQGVYLKRGWTRHLQYGELARDVLGTLQDGSGSGGIEGGFDEHLRGTAGEEIQARDSGRNPIPGQSILVKPPVPGGDVILTLDRDIQEIGHEALAAAIRETGAKGGNLIVTDPGTGEILSLVSIQDGKPGNLSAINSPYEPGSTLKPFTVAAILGHSVASLADSVDGGGGRWMAGGKMLTDVHPYGKMTLGDALRVSSNVGVAKVAEGLSRAQQYEMLRDFGFGTRTGIELQPEASGKLPRPSDWSRTSPSRLAIGYEISVTPIQMAMAYGALANGGKLMEPQIIKELRDPDGQTVFRSKPTVVREVIPAGLAREISQVLVEVVEGGTGSAAQLASFAVAGKSGTSRAHGDGGYVNGHYASFVCFFPAEDPQLVVFVKLDRPEGSYYGGSTAAPVTRATMEAVLAAHQAPIDWEAMASLDRRQPRNNPSPGAQFASSTLSSPPPVRTPRTSSPPETGAVVPDVSGLSPRLAVRRLHALGFRVLMDSSGPVVGTDPPAFSPLSPGDTVRILSGRVGDG